ncbi:hypothetical protein CFN58_05675 [Pseudomonas avellanae]|uniref:Uncharacterized protein n=1 Tax=Pseudomonas avellanae TaxID=46257 RepID=A0A261WM61_9PSED|nr:hypothetical protein CFN58_05675 [Pseudomonas avellanae]
MRIDPAIRINDELIKSLYYLLGLPKVLWFNWDALYDIKAGAEGLGLLLARIEDDQFVITDGRSIPLSECKIEFS